MGNIYDVDLWDELNWGILNPAEEDVLAALLPSAPTRAARRATARRHLAQMLGRARQFHAAIDWPARPPGTDLFLVVGH